MPRKFQGGYVNDLSEDQKKCLSELYENIKDWKTKVEGWNCKTFCFDDRTLLRFLRARDFDVPKATKMIEKTLEYREKWRPDLIKLSDDGLQKSLETGTWRLAGKTIQGNPIQLIQVSKFIAKDVTNLDDYAKILLFQREASLTSMANDGWKVETTVVIFDMAGWSLFNQGSPHGMSCTRMLVDMVQNHYPESLECAIIFNAPFIFRSAWAIIKPWLDPVTAAKVVFVSDPKVLKASINEETLMERYGGTRKEEYPLVPEYLST